MASDGNATDQPTTQIDEPVTLNTTNEIYQSHSDPLIAATSLEDSGHGKRPRDARLLHIILASLGVQAYQERIPLQLMDFAYRYTSSILQDALHLTNESYGTTHSSSKSAIPNDFGSITLQALRLAVASRQHYQFQSSLPKEHFQEIAAEKNKIALPLVGKSTQVRLPPERYCLTGVGFNLRDEWEDDIEVDNNDNPRIAIGIHSGDRSNGRSPADSQMQGLERPERIAEGEDEEMRDI